MSNKTNGQPEFATTFSGPKEFRAMNAEDTQETMAEEELRQVMAGLCSHNQKNQPENKLSHLEQAQIDTNKETQISSNEESDNEFVDASDVLNVDWSKDSPAVISDGRDMSSNVKSKGYTEEYKSELFGDITQNHNSEYQVMTNPNTNCTFCEYSRSSRQQEQPQLSSDLKHPLQTHKNGSQRNSEMATGIFEGKQLEVEEMSETSFQPTSQQGATPKSPFMNMSREETIYRVQKQVHFYFGDRNYPTDKFLRKHAKKSDNNWIPLSVLCTYKKMKKLTRDISLMAEALKSSDVVDVNETATAIRRRHPPPKYHPEAICAATVVVTLLPSTHCGFEHANEHITSTLNKFGRIVKLRRVDSLCDIPDEVQHFFCVMLETSMPTILTSSVHGTRYLVEFDYADEALDATTEAEERASVFNRVVGNLHVTLLYKRRRNRHLDSNQSSAVQTPTRIGSASVSRTTTPTMFQQGAYNQHLQQHLVSEKRGGLQKVPTYSAALIKADTSTSPPQRFGRVRASSLDAKAAHAWREASRNGIHSPGTVSSRDMVRRQASRTPDPQTLRGKSNQELAKPFGSDYKRQKPSPLSKGGAQHLNWRSLSSDASSFSNTSTPASSSTKNKSRSGDGNDSALGVFLKPSPSGSSPLKYEAIPVGHNDTEPYRPTPKVSSSGQSAACCKSPIQDNKATSSPYSQDVTTLTLYSKPMPTSPATSRREQNNFRGRSYDSPSFSRTNQSCSSASPRARTANASQRFSEEESRVLKRIPIAPDGTRGFTLKRTPFNC